MVSLTRGAAAVAVVALIAAAPAPLSGTWALPGGVPKANATMQVTQQGAMTAFDIVENPIASDTAIKSFDLDMTQLMHFIVISDDFTQFTHVHPKFDPKTGHFTQTLTLDPSQRYFAYADTEPKGIGQQVFRFAILPKHPTRMIARINPTPSPLSVTAGPYSVVLSTTKVTAGTPATVAVTVMRNGKPATGMTTYLGAAAHAVFIDTQTLAYVHVHPTADGDPMAGMDMDSMGSMDMGPAKAGPKMTMKVPALAAGTYKLWLQFATKRGLYTAPFTLAVR